MYIYAYIYIYIHVYIYIYICVCVCVCVCVCGSSANDRYEIQKSMNFLLPLGRIKFNNTLLEINT